MKATDVLAKALCIALALVWVAFCYIAMQRLMLPHQTVQRTVCAEVQPKVIVCDKQSVARYATE